LSNLIHILTIIYKTKFLFDSKIEESRIILFLDLIFEIGKINLYNFIKNNIDIFIIELSSLQQQELSTRFL
jgi:hypothetical protein